MATRGDTKWPTKSVDGKITSRRRRKIKTGHASAISCKNGTSFTQPSEVCSALIRNPHNRIENVWSTFRLSLLYLFEYRTASKKRSSTRFAHNLRPLIFSLCNREQDSSNQYGLVVRPRLWESLVAALGVEAKIDRDSILTTWVTEIRLMSYESINVSKLN
jgi:hypothetical protein